jgi:tRNA (adenine57-N1/adenine58-N1)-methyltransferase
MGKTYQHSGQTIPHNALIGIEDGSAVTLSGGTKFVVLRPTLAEYIMKMPRGAQVIYPKDLATILLWADIYPRHCGRAGSGPGAHHDVAACSRRGWACVSHEIRDDLPSAHWRTSRYTWAKWHTTSFAAKTSHWESKRRTSTGWY